MSNPNNSEQKQSFHEAQGIPLVNIPRAKAAIKLVWKSGGIPALVGPAGIGKTQTIEQCMKELAAENSEDTWGFRAFYSPLTPPEKFQGLPYRSKHNPDTVQTCIDEELWNTLSSAPKGVVLIDELNRADDDTLKAIFVLLSERRTGAFEIPEGWHIACAMNPSGEDYKVNDIFVDPAMRRRLTYIGLKVDAKAWMTYARSAGFHKGIVDFVASHPELLLDEKTRDVGKQYANPAGWEKVSDQLKALSTTDPDYSGLPEDYTPYDETALTTLRQVIGGTIGTNAAGEFIAFLRDSKDVMQPLDVLKHYSEPGSTISVLVAEALGEPGTPGASRHDRVVSLIKGVVMALFTTRPETDQKLAKNFGQFALDLPEELRALLNSEVQTAGEDSPEASAWLKGFQHNAIMYSTAYQQGLLSLHSSHEELEQATKGHTAR